MKKKTFFWTIRQNFFEERSDEKTILSKLSKKMVFYIFGANLDFS